MQDKLYDFQIPCSWSIYGTAFVQARNLDDAIELVNRGELPDDSEYMDGSFEIDIETAEIMNKKIIKQIKIDKSPLNYIVESSFPNGEIV